MKNTIENIIGGIGLIGLCFVIIGLIIMIWVGVIGAKIVLTGIIVAGASYITGKAVEEI